MVRTFHSSAPLLPLMLTSISLFWPRNIGRCIIVADDSAEDRTTLRLLMPDWCELQYETVPAEMSRAGHWLMQWHDLWADNYSSAAYVAIMDTDAFFTHKVTPDVLFDPADRVLQTVHPAFQPQLFVNDTLWWLGTAAAARYREPRWLQLYPVNFMQTLPQVFPLALFPAFRRFMLTERFPQCATFDDVNRLFLRSGRYRNPSQFVLLGNYWLFFAPQELRDRAHTVRQDDAGLQAERAALQLPPPSLSDRVYAVRLKPSVHVPHTTYFRRLPRAHSEDKIDYPVLFDVSLQLMQTGLCMTDDTCWRTAASLPRNASAVHAHQLLIYCWEDSLWDVAKTHMSLVLQHVYHARFAWLRALIAVCQQEGRRAAEQWLTRFPTAVEFDLQHQQKELKSSKQAAGDLMLP